MKVLKLTHEERQILQKLTSNEIGFLKRIYKDSEFVTFKKIVNTLIDVEKNIFFGEDGSKLTPEGLYSKHAYARGGIARLTTFLRLMAGAEEESARRENERKKQKEESGSSQ